MHQGSVWLTIAELVGHEVPRRVLVLVLSMHPAMPMERDADAGHQLSP